MRPAEYRSMARNVEAVIDFLEDARRPVFPQEAREWDEARRLLLEGARRLYQLARPDDFGDEIEGGRSENL